MYDFHHNYIKQKINAELLFTDTDGLTYKTKTDNVHEDFYEGKYLLDFSNYAEDSKFYDPSNMNVIGKMTDESKEKRNDKFTGLKSKMHSLTNVDGKEKKQENESILSKT